jgi:hypothetical protein
MHSNMSRGRQQYKLGSYTKPIDCHMFYSSLASAHLVQVYDPCTNLYDTVDNSSICQDAEYEKTKY